MQQLLPRKKLWNLDTYPMRRFTLGDASSSSPSPPSSPQATLIRPSRTRMWVNSETGETAAAGSSRPEEDVYKPHVDNLGFVWCPFPY